LGFAFLVIIEIKKEKWRKGPGKSDLGLDQEGQKNGKYGRV